MGTLRWAPTMTRGRLSVLECVRLFGRLYARIPTYVNSFFVIPLAVWGMVAIDRRKL